jgi:hypothetical protein
VQSLVQEGKEFSRGAAGIRADPGGQFAFLRSVKQACLPSGAPALPPLALRGLARLPSTVCLPPRDCEFALQLSLFAPPSAPQVSARGLSLPELGAP